MESLETSGYSEKLGSQDVSGPFLPQLLLKYFTVCHEESINDKVLAKCNTCEAKIKASIKATSNMITHPKRCIVTKYTEYLNEKEIDAQKKKHGKIEHERKPQAQQSSILSYVKKKENKFNPKDLSLRL